MNKYLVYNEADDLIDVMLASTASEVKQLWSDSDKLTVKAVELSKQERISIAIETEKHLGGLAKVIK